MWGLKNPSENRVLGDPLPPTLEKSALSPRTPVTMRADRPAHKPLKARSVTTAMAMGVRMAKFSPRKSISGRISLFSLPRPETKGK
jgi:hypothetical protein